MIGSFVCFKIGIRKVQEIQHLPQFQKVHLCSKKGNLLGFLVLKEGMIIDLEQAEAISKIILPNSRKAMQSFLGKIDFVHIFIPNFSQVVKPMQFLVKKDVPFKWSDEQKNAFTKIQKSIAEVPALMSPDFSKDFILDTFATDFSYAVVLT